MNSSQRYDTRAWLLFAAMSVLWGIPYLMIKIAVTGVSVPVLVFGRSALGAAVLLPLVLGRGRLAPLLAHWRPLVAFATIESRARAPIRLANLL